MKTNYNLIVNHGKWEHANQRLSIERIINIMLYTEYYSYLQRRQFCQYTNICKYLTSIGLLMFLIDRCISSNITTKY